jgi:hypothetical protein
MVDLEELLLLVVEHTRIWVKDVRQTKMRTDGVLPEEPSTFEFEVTTKVKKIRLIR